MATSTTTRKVVTTRKKVLVPVQPTETTDAGVGHVFASQGDITIVIDALRSRAKRWKTVEANEKNLKELAKKVARRKAKKATLPPAFVAGDYILYGGKARWGYTNDGQSPEAAFRECCRIWIVINQLKDTLNAHNSGLQLEMPSFEEFIESVEDDE